MEVILSTNNVFVKKSEVLMDSCSAHGQPSNRRACQGDAHRYCVCVCTCVSVRVCEVLCIGHSCSKDGRGGVIEKSEFRINCRPVTDLSFHWNMRTLMQPSSERW